MRLKGQIFLEWGILKWVLLLGLVIGLILLSLYFSKTISNAGNVISEFFKNLFR